MKVHRGLGTKITPVPDQIPPNYSHLLDRFRTWSVEAQKSATATDPLLALKGTGAHLWSDAAPDAIRLSCAAAAGVDLFIANDARLHAKQVAGIQFIVSLDRAPL